MEGQLREAKKKRGKNRSVVEVYRKWVPFQQKQTILEHVASKARVVRAVASTNGSCYETRSVAAHHEAVLKKKKNPVKPSKIP